MTAFLWPSAVSSSPWSSAAGLKGSSSSSEGLNGLSASRDSTYFWVSGAQLLELDLSLLPGLEDQFDLGPRHARVLALHLVFAGRVGPSPHLLSQRRSTARQEPCDETGQFDQRAAMKNRSHRNLSSRKTRYAWRTHYAYSCRFKEGNQFLASAGAFVVRSEIVTTPSPATQATDLFDKRSWSCGRADGRFIPDSEHCQLSGVATDVHGCLARRRFATITRM